MQRVGIETMLTKFCYPLLVGTMLSTFALPQLSVMSYASSGESGQRTTVVAQREGDPQQKGDPKGKPQPQQKQLPQPSAQPKQQPGQPKHPQGSQPGHSPQQHYPRPH